MTTHVPTLAIIVLAALATAIFLHAGTLTLSARMAGAGRLGYWRATAISSLFVLSTTIMAALLRLIAQPIPGSPSIASPIFNAAAIPVNMLVLMTLIRAMCKITPGRAVLTAAFNWLLSFVVIGAVAVVFVLATREVGPAVAAAGVP